MKIIRAIMIVGIIVVCGYMLCEKQEMDKVQAGIAKKIIRFHVRANSDSKEDQELKLMVRDAVCEYLSPKLKESENIEMTRSIVNESIEEIKGIALEVIHSQGKDYTVEAYFEKAYFPLKVYGDMAFPPGEYEAFRIDIGGGKGQNWWCVMYPPLCFVDATYAVVPKESQEQLQQILTPTEYDALNIRNRKECDVEYEFKYLKFLN